MKKCPQCERSLPDNAQQCIFCGERLDSTPSSEKTTQQPVRQPVNQPVNQPVKQSSGPVLYHEPPKTTARTQGTSNKLLYGIIALLTTLLVGGAIAWFLTQNKANETTETELVANPEAVDSTVAAPQDTKQQDRVSTPTKAQDDMPPAEDYEDTNCYIGKVVVTGTDVRLRSTPQINNHNILKGRNGKNLHPRKGEVLPCIDIEGDFYYVDFHGIPCYISSQFTSLME